MKVGEGRGTEKMWNIVAGIILWSFLDHNPYGDSVLECFLLKLWSGFMLFIDQLLTLNQQANSYLLISKLILLSDH